MQPIHKNIINKWLKLHFYNYDSRESALSQDEDFGKNTLLYFKSSNEFIQMKFMKGYGSGIRFLIDYDKNIYPSENIQLAAVQKNGKAIRYLFYLDGGFLPSEAVQLAAVQEDYESICYIVNPYPSVIELYEKLSGKKYEKQ